MSHGLTLMIWLMGHVALRMKLSFVKSAPGLVWCSWVFYNLRYKVFSLPTGLKNHLIEESCKFQGGSPLQYFITLTSLVTIGIVIMEICFLICLATWRGHMCKKSCEYMGRNFDSHRNCGICDEMMLAYKISQYHIITASYGFIGRSS